MTRTGQAISSPRRSLRCAPASSGEAWPAAPFSGPAAARPGHRRPAPSSGPARMSASMGWLPRRAWHHSAAKRAPAACADTTTVSMASAARRCVMAASRQAK